MVKLRLKRFGRKNSAFWRINAIDIRTARDGKVIEELGFYDPITKDKTKAVVVNKARVEYWLSVGAQPSDTVRGLLTHAVDSSTLIPPPRNSETAPAAAPTA